MSGTPLFDTSYSTTDINKSSSRGYDDAWVKGGVEITLRGQRFVLLRQDYLNKLIEEARDDRPKSLDDLLLDYDASKIQKLTSGFTNEPPTGKELI